MEKIDKKIEYQEFLEKDLDKYIKEYQEIKVFKLVVSEHFKKLLFCNNKCAEFKLKGFAIDTDGKIIKEEESVANTQIVDVTFKELLNYQRAINATELNEEVISDDGIDKILYYKNQKANDIDGGYERQILKYKASASRLGEKTCQVLNKNMKT